MVKTPTNSQETFLLELPKTIELQVTQEQFLALSAANRDLKLERNAFMRINCESTNWLGNWKI